VNGLLRRLPGALLTTWLVATLCFVLVRALPGGPFDDVEGLDPVIRANLEAAYDLDAPWPEQYARWLTGLLRGDFGPSFRYRDTSVGEVLAEGLPVSLALGCAALLVALVAGLLAGALAARRRGTWVDAAVMGASTVGLAVPNFALAGVLVLLLAFHWPLLPPAGWGSPAQIVLPALALGLPLAASVARLFRTGLLDALGEDWVRTARAKGMRESRLVWRHAARAALVPVVSWLGPAAAAVLTGSLVVERLFAIAGLGSHFVESAFNADYNLAVAVVVVYTALVCLMNMLADAAAELLDPRLAEAGESDA
jgi:oligopeptide transport system permease protein